MLKEINERISELEIIKLEMDELSREKRLELANKEAECNELRTTIEKNLFINTDNYKELQELKATKKWMDIYSKKTSNEEGSEE